MSNDELGSNDEIKEFKEEGEEDKLASENLHSSLKNNLVDHLKFVPFFSMRMPHWIPPPFPPPAHYNPFPATYQPTFGYSYFGGYRPSLPHHHHHHQFHPLPTNNHLPPHHGLNHSPTYHQPLSLMPPDSTKFNSLQFEPHSPSSSFSSDPSTSHSHVKKPLNSFMIFMKENRAKVAAQSEKKESATINQILGKMWHSLPPEEQEKYYRKAKSAKDVHRELYPCWTAKDNYSVTNKKKKKREKTSTEGNLKKCRARFGLEDQTSWCKPCRRKKKCIKFSAVEAS